MQGYTSNVNDGLAWTNTATRGAAEHRAETQSARTMLVEGGNGTLNQTDLSSIADQLNDIVASIKQTANTQYDGMYIFAGNDTQTQPYSTTVGQDTYAGNAGTVLRSIGPATTVQVNANLSSVLGNGQASGDGGLLDTLETASQDLQNGNIANLGTDLSALWTRTCRHLTPSRPRSARRRTS